jgi:signal transduction histidine kinase
MTPLPGTRASTERPAVQDAGPPAAASGGRARWWGAAAGVLLAIVDTFSAAMFGVSFSMGGRDVTLLVCAYFGLSFATLGFLAGYVLDLRRRDRHTAAVVQQQMEAINAAQARLAQSRKLAELGQLAATVAHEVRNPLAVIRSATQDIAERLAASDQDGKRSASFVTAEIDRLTNVIASLLTLARPLKIERKPIAVDALLGRALLLARGADRARPVPVRAPGHLDLPLLEVDADLLCQVLLDLLANAAEAAAPGGEITLTAQGAEAGVAIVVADSGPGVPPDLRARIFEPFFTTRPDGTGLGLAVARQIVEAHGGRITVTEREGGGAAFTIWLPAAQRTPAAA